MIRGIKWIVAGFIMLAALTFLYVKAQDVDIELYNHITTNLSSMKQVDATLNQDILKSRNELLLNYDPLVSGIKQLKKHNHDIIEVPYVFNKGEAEIVQELEDINELIEQKGIWLEEFKSENAILRNSLHYIPTLSDEIIASLTESNVDISLINNVSDFYGDTLSYAISWDSLYVTHVVSHVNALRNELDLYPAINR